jgi:hypothetical protein
MKIKALYIILVLLDIWKKVFLKMIFPINIVLINKINKKARIYK